MPSSVSAHTIKQVSLKGTLALKLRNTLLKAIVEETALKKVSNFEAERERFIKKALLKSSTFLCLRSKIYSMLELLYYK